MDDIEVWRQMYGILCVATDKALTHLENLRVHDAMETLQSALIRAEDLFITAEQAACALSEYRNENEKS